MDSLLDRMTAIAQDAMVSGIDPRSALEVYGHGTADLRSIARERAEDWYRDLID